MNTTNIVDGEDDENSLTFFWAQTKKSTAKTKPKYNHLMRTDENVKIIIYNIYMIWITSICQFQILQWSKQAPHPTPLMKATNQTVGFTVEAIHVWPAGGGVVWPHDRFKACAYDANRHYFSHHGCNLACVVIKKDEGGGGRDVIGGFKPIYHIKHGLHKSCNDAPLLPKTTKSTTLLGVNKLHVFLFCMQHMISTVWSKAWHLKN